MIATCGNCDSSDVEEISWAVTEGLTGRFLFRKRKVICHACGRFAVYHGSRWMDIFHAARNLMFSNVYYPSIASKGWMPLFYE